MKPYQNDGRSLSARTIDYPITVPAQSREESAQDRNAEQNETSKMKPLPHQKTVEDELVEYTHQKDIL